MDKWQKITKMKTKQKTTAQIKLQTKMRWTAETVPKTALKMLPETVMETKTSNAYDKEQNDYSGRY